MYSCYNYRYIYTVDTNVFMLQLPVYIYCRYECIHVTTTGIYIYTVDTNVFMLQLPVYIYTVDTNVFMLQLPVYIYIL